MIRWYPIALTAFERLALKSGMPSALEGKIRAPRVTFTTSGRVAGRPIREFTKLRHPETSGACLRLIQIAATISKRRRIRAPCTPFRRYRAAKDNGRDRPGRHFGVRTDRDPVGTADPM